LSGLVKALWSEITGDPPQEAGEAGYDRVAWDSAYRRRLNAAAGILLFGEAHGVERAKQLVKVYPPQDPAGDCANRRLLILGLGACFGGPLESYAWRGDGPFGVKRNYLSVAKQLFYNLSRDKDACVRGAARWLNERLSTKKDGSL
jgi:hypothetical protein